MESMGNIDVSLNDRVRSSLFHHFLFSCFLFVVEPIDRKIWLSECFRVHRNWDVKFTVCLFKLRCPWTILIFLHWFMWLSPSALLIFSYENLSTIKRRIVHYSLIESVAFFTPIFVFIWSNGSSLSCIPSLCNCRWPIQNARWLARSSRSWIRRKDPYLPRGMISFNDRSVWGDTLGFHLVFFPYASRGHYLSGTSVKSRETSRTVV